MKTQSKYIGLTVINPDLTPDSPNKYGKVTECKKFFRQKCLYTVEFRDLTEWWGLSFMKNNLKK